ncbi:MAG: murein biosynthesis integral membrane protein MurJ [Ktedonobacteraceae bacterium]|nr:murein biosynthesis integral membrane protein MurJ [Ktedonobacteraceae bacterium]
MENEGQQPPLPPQGPPGPQGYYGWQYDQEQPGPGVYPPATPPEAMYPPQQSPGYTPGVQGVPPQPIAPQPIPTRYQQPIADMGTSLGYGQGQEYIYSNAPQPSQPIPVLRQARLQQLREERMRRQLRRVQQPDLTSVIQRKIFKRPPEGGVPPPIVSSAPSQAPPWSPGVPPAGPHVSPTGVPPTPVLPLQMSPALPPAEVAPARASALPPPALHGLSGRHAIPMQPASTVSQDTGMIQRVRVRNATFILTGAFLASRVLGLLRTAVFAYVLGTTKTSDAYLQAFLIPDTIFNIVAGGALSSAFIPVFSKYMVGENDEKTAWHVASSALNLAISIMVVLALIIIIFADKIVPIYNPNPGQPAAVYGPYIALITALTRIMLLQAIVLGSGVIINSVLNARQNFLLPAIGTVLYNVGLIIGLIPGGLLALVGQRNDTVAVYAATFGVVLGAILQVAIQIPGLPKVGMHYQLSFDWRHPGVIQIGRQMLPRIVNAAMLSASVFVDRFLISLLGALVVDKAIVDGFITQYFQAFTLLMLPLGVFGMAVSTAAFPTLAEYVARGRMDRVRSIVLETLRNILFLSIPASVGLIILALPIIQALLEHGRFTLTAAQNTTVPLSFFALGLAGLAAVEILTRAFYALRDSTTPVIVSVSQFIFKIALSIILIGPFANSPWGVQWGMGALALSTSLAGLIEAVVLLWLLHQRIGELIDRSLGLFVTRVLVAALAMGVGVLIVRLILDIILNTTDPTRASLGGLVGTLVAIIKLAIELMVGAFIYLRGSRMLGIEEMGPVKRLLERFKLSWI